MQLSQPIMVLSDLARSYKMENIEYKTDTFGTEHVLIHKEDGSITSMSKAHYEAQQVEHLTSPLTDPTA
jgi:hypothetical protein